jgi:hypothetical protein
MKTPLPPPLRIGLLMNAWEHRAWAFRMLEVIEASDYATIELIVLNDSTSTRDGLLKRVWDNRHIAL